MYLSTVLPLCVQSRVIVVDVTVSRVRSGAAVQNDTYVLYKKGACVCVCVGGIHQNTLRLVVVVACCFVVELLFWGNSLTPFPIRMKPKVP